MNLKYLDITKTSFNLNFPPLKSQSSPKESSNFQEDFKFSLEKTEESENGSFFLFK